MLKKVDNEMMMARMLSEGVECRTTETQKHRVNAREIQVSVFSRCLGASVLKKADNEMMMARMLSEGVECRTTETQKH
jgi:hypothetical protein